MATWAIGDVQGCAATLQRLLDEISLDLGRDRVWFVGDLVNRGPRSLQALRTVRGLGDAASVVLGNHDLHLLARADGVGKAGKRDTLDDVLGAEDRDELLAWLGARPLVVRDGAHLLVHAGLLPGWTAADAESRARAAEAALRGPGRREFLARYERREEDRCAGAAGCADDAVALTNVRVVRADGTPDLAFKGAPSDAPEGCFPWYRAPARRNRDVTIVFGHWAALGYHASAGILALDSGCVWGGRLTAVRLEDRRVASVPNED